MHCKIFDSLLCVYINICIHTQINIDRGCAFTKSCDTVFNRPGQINGRERHDFIYPLYYVYVF